MMIVKMSRVVKIEITEEAETLKKLMRLQKDKSGSLVSDKLSLCTNCQPILRVLSRHF